MTQTLILITFCPSGFTILYINKHKYIHIQIFFLWSTENVRDRVYLYPGEGNSTLLQYSCLENSMEEPEGCSPWGRWGSDTTEQLHFHALEKKMATHSSVLAWRIPGTEEPGRRPSMGSHRVGHYWSNLAAYLYPKIFVCFSKNKSILLHNHNTLIKVRKFLWLKYN